MKLSLLRFRVGWLTVDELRTHPRSEWPALCQAAPKVSLLHAALHPGHCLPLLSRLNLHALPHPTPTSRLTHPAVIPRSKSSQLSSWTSLNIYSGHPRKYISHGPLTATPNFLAFPNGLFESRAFFLLHLPGELRLSSLRPPLTSSWAAPSVTGALTILPECG